jgi:hypothetical protein
MPRSESLERAHVEGVLITRETVVRFDDDGIEQGFEGEVNEKRGDERGW